MFRYRARNWPQTLDPQERARWQAYRVLRLTDTEASRGRTLAAFFTRLSELREERHGDARAGEVLDALEAWGRELEAGIAT